MNILNDENLNKLKKNQILIGVLNPYSNEKKLKEITSKNINCFSLRTFTKNYKSSINGYTIISSKFSRI